MVRTKEAKRKKGDFSADSMAQALELVKKGKSFRQAASQTNLKKSTIERYYKKSLASPEVAIQLKPRYDTRRIFTDSMESDFSTYLINCSKMFYGLSKVDCKKAAFHFGKRNGCILPKSWEDNQMAGEDWYIGFMRRHPQLSLCSPEQCSLSRATSFNRNNVEVFFNNLIELINRNPQFADGTRIFNLDETGLTTVQNPRKIIAEKGSRQCARVTSAEKGTLVTLCCIVGASGMALPPVMVFPRVNFKNHMIHGASPGTKGLATKTGWMTSDLFVEVMKHFIDKSGSTPNNPSLLLFDNHESHLYADVINLAKDNGVHILTFPPHTTNKLQPLDVGLYRPLKTFYNAAVDAWMSMNPGKTFNIYDIAACIGPAHARAMTPSNISSAFRSTGIFPLDKNIFSDEDFLPSSVTDRPPPTNTETSNSKSPTTTPDRPTEEVSILHSPTPATENLPNPSYSNPEQILGYPKAGPRTSSGKRREKGRSLIATDTPEKLLLEEKTKNRLLKLNRKSGKSNTIKKSLFFHPKKNTTEVSCTQPKTQESDEDEDGLLSSKDCSDGESDNGLQSISELSKETDSLQVGMYFLRQFNVKSATFFYIGEILEQVENGEGDFKVSYLRRSQKNIDKFIHPNVPDHEIIKRNEIFAVLPPPIVNKGTTSRQKNILHFNIKLRSDIR